MNLTDMYNHYYYEQAGKFFLFNNNLDERK